MYAINLISKALTGGQNKLECVSLTSSLSSRVGSSVEQRNCYTSQILDYTGNALPGTNASAYFPLFSYIWVLAE